VTLAEALTELGLEPGADAETVRRAYLRLIKVRKPESDPEGFKRTREAYETARAVGELEALAVQSAGYGEPSAAGAPAGGAPEPRVEAQGGGAARGGGAAGAPASPPEAAFAGFVSAWRAVPASADPRHRIEIARQAVAALPRDPRAHWLLASSLAGRATDMELAEALRAGYRAGWPEFLEALLVRVPNRATRAEADEAIASPRVTLQLAGASLVASWDPPRAAALVKQLCANPGLSQSDGLPIGRVLDVVLALHVAGAVGPAREAQDALRTWLHDAGRELELTRGPFGASWLLAEELARLPAKFPPPLRTAFAVATRTGDLRTAYYDACFQVRERRRTVKRWARELHDSAPNVANVLASALNREARRRVTFRMPGYGWWLVPAILGIIRFVVEQQVPSGPPYHYNATPQLPPHQYVPNVGAGSSLDAARAAQTQLCVAPPPGEMHIRCSDMRDLVTELDEGFCGQAKLHLQLLMRRLIGQSLDTLEQRFLTLANAAISDTCGSSGSSYEVPGQGTAL
jgi:hypothetical protein